VEVALKLRTGGCTKYERSPTPPSVLAFPCNIEEEEVNAQGDSKRMQVLVLSHVASSLDGAPCSTHDPTRDQLCFVSSLSGPPFPLFLYRTRLSASQLGCRLSPRFFLAPCRPFMQRLSPQARIRLPTCR
jgi:hypothetical protein